MKSTDRTANHHWQNLLELSDAFKQFSIKNHLSKANPELFAQQNLGVYFDFSKVRADETVIDSLIEYGQSIGLAEQIEKLFQGNYKNKSEKTKVLHPAIRGSIENLNLSKIIELEKQKMIKIANQLNQSQMRGFSGRAIKHLVHIGIGGSEFGIKALFHSLKKKDAQIETHFISSLDGLELERLLEKYPIDQMLFVVVSKSFKTEDTLNNAEFAKEQLLKLTSKSAIKHHFIGVSASKKRMNQFGIDESHQLQIWDWLSGRYSSFSAVSLALMVNIGVERFNNILSGANHLDCHFRDEKNYKKNIPVLMAMLHFWHFSFLKMTNLAIFPYDALLQELPMHLQQLIMESLGKKTNTSGEKIQYPTSPLVMGDLGTRSQHAFYQLLYQGEPELLAHFILTAKSKNSRPLYHQRSQLHALVQSFGLSQGENHNDSNHHYPGNLPLIQIVLPEANDYYLGYLFALYEQVTFVWSVLLDINPFDQWGVEYGKRLASEAKLSAKTISKQPHLDLFSNRLIEWLNQQKQN